MSQQELLIGIARHFDGHGILYMLIGSIASSLYGEPRLTHDIDLIVSIAVESAAGIAQAFPSPRYYLDDRESIRQMIDSFSMFNLIDTQTGDKVDFWILTDSPFDSSRFQRRRPVSVFGSVVSVSSPEDVILAKLHWAQLSGGSEKQFLDALRVYEVQRERLDVAYCATWVRELGVTALWERMVSEAAP